MKGSDKAVVLGIVMALFLGGFYLKVLSPKRGEASSLSTEITKLQAEIDQEKQTAAFGEQARTEFPKYYGRLVVLGKAVPNQADTASLLVQLNAVATGAGVDFRSIALGAGATGGSTASAAPPPPTTSSSSTTSTTSTTPSAGSSSSGSSGSSSTTAASTTTAAPATEASAASQPIGSTVGPAGLPTMPYNLTFTGQYFAVADFLKSLDDLVDQRPSGQIAADGRLLTIDGFSLSPVPDSGVNPLLNVNVSVTSYVTPAEEGLTAGASPSGPAPSLTQPPTQPASQTVSP